MKIVKKINALRKQLAPLRRKGKRVGFVPTMGFLHKGHLSLIKRARRENDVVVVSIFVNPTQFSPNEDFKKYPRDLKRDIRLLKGLCDILFIPSASQMYDSDFATYVEVKGLSDLCGGRTRKGHFTGVATVVAKLFNIVSPDNAYFGQKDAQQAAIIKKMAADLNFPVSVRVSPIVREEDGLAMSSRNTYLSEEERRDAVVLFQALKSAQRLVKSKGIRDTGRIKAVLCDLISRTEKARIDYIEIADRSTFRPLKSIGTEALLLLAVYVGSTRLIDNIILKPGR